MQSILIVLLAVNVMTFLLYGADKLLAMLHRRRVPERWLWGTALCGGVAGALTGMWLFRHKTSKTSFQLVLALGILFEVALVVFLQHIF